MPLNPFIIPIFIPQSGCPHQCVFCNQKIITGAEHVHNFQQVCQHARDTVQSCLAYERDKRRKVELAFFGGNFLGQKPAQIDWYIQFAQSLHRAGCIDAIRFSTRPDTITCQTLSQVQNMPVAVVELGVQSMHDDVLAYSGRGHSSQHTISALRLLRQYGFRAGVQIMTGLPGDTPAKAKQTVNLLSDFAPVCARIYPTLVLPGSPLALQYNDNRYRPQTLEEAVILTAQLYRIFTRSNVRVIRMGLQAADDLAAKVIAGPHHPAFGHMVKSRLFLEKLEAWLSSNLDQYVQISVHPSQLSHLRGLSNSNVKTLATDFPAATFAYGQDLGLTRTQLNINGVTLNILD